MNTGVEIALSILKLGIDYEEKQVKELVMFIVFVECIR